MTATASNPARYAHQCQTVEDLLANTGLSSESELIAHFDVLGGDQRRAAARIVFGYDEATIAEMMGE